MPLSDSDSWLWHGVTHGVTRQMLCDDPSIAAKPSLLAVTPVNERFNLVFIKVTGFCAHHHLNFSFLYIPS